MNTNEHHRKLIDSYRKGKEFSRRYHEGLRFLLDPYGLSVMEGDILFALYRNPRCDSVTKLCADIGKTKGVVSRACDHLTKINYLTGRNDDDDRRVIHFKITPAARSLIGTVSRYMEAMEYLRNAEPGEDLFLARIDVKKALLYPITRDETTETPSFLPFFPYESFLKERLLPHLKQEDRENFWERFRAAALKEACRRKEAVVLPSKLEQKGKILSAVISAEAAENSDTVMFRIKKQ